MRRRILQGALVAAALAAMTLTVGLWRLVVALSEPYAGFSEPAVVDYAPGTSAFELADRLADRGVVRSRWLFLAVRTVRPDAILQAGEYEFSEPSSVWDVFSDISNGRVKLYALTIPEGLTRFETAAVVGDSQFATEEEFLELTADPAPIQDLFPEAESLEGVLYPETYHLPRTADGERLLEVMLEAFRENFTRARLGAVTELEPYEALALASMVEKETAVATERPLVSSVYHNRLERDMRMQCDPTIIYGLLLEGRYRGAIYESDIRDPHAYNTYVHQGLPPGPIASPGWTSMRAAFHPAETDYLFFVAESTQSAKHVFTETLSAHNRAVAAYRRTR